MSDRDAIEAAWRGLTSASARRDGAMCTQALAVAVRVGLLQTAGPAAFCVLETGCKDPDAVTDLVRALDARGWTGDDLLAELLGSLMCDAAAGRRRLDVDLDMLADVLGDPRGGYLDLASGEAWPMDIVDDGQVEDIDPDHEDPDPARWLDVMGEGSGPAYQDMVDFTAGLSDTDARGDLERALDGRGAFQRFQAALDRHEQLRVHWRVLFTERRTGRARAWLADHGYDTHT